MRRLVDERDLVHPLGTRGAARMVQFSLQFNNDRDPDSVAASGFRGKQLFVVRACVCGCAPSTIYLCYFGAERFANFSSVTWLPVLTAPCLSLVGWSSATLKPLAESRLGRRRRGDCGPFF